MRIVSVLLVSAAAAGCAWFFIPSTPVDRALVRVVAGATANPPFIIAGEGTLASPWSVRVLAPHRTADPSLSPVVISLADDREGIFQSSPPSPVDIAVILKNMRRLGAENAAIGAVLAWEKPDTIALTALDSELASFKRTVTAAPLSRGATGSPLPQSFRRASLPVSAVKGDAGAIPVVNRLALPDVILGQENTLSGFTLLENEPGGTPLVARWDDRIVLAFPLVSTLARLGIPAESVEVRLGNHIRLGKNGPIVPIDDFGRLTANAGKIKAPQMVSAAALIDTGQPLPENNLTLLRDDQSNAEASTRSFSETLVPLIAGISSDAGMSEPRYFRRGPAASELALIGAVCLLIASLFARTKFVREVSCGIIAATFLALHFILAATASFWLATIPILSATLAAVIFGRIFFREITTYPVAAPHPAPASQDTEPGPAVTEPAPIPEEAPPGEPAAKPAKKAARKTAAKAAPAKKAAKKAGAKKTPAKKTAKKTTRARKPKSTD